MLDLRFTSTVIEWRGPAPYYYLPLSEEAAEDVHDVRQVATYGWGVIPVVARIGDVEFFHQFVRSMFLHRRKFLRGVLAGMVRGQIEKQTIDELLAAFALPADIRAEQLPVETHIALAAAVRSAGAASISP